MSCAPPRFVFGCQTLMRDTLISSNTAGVQGDLNSLKSYLASRFIQWPKANELNITVKLLGRQDIDTVILGHHNLSPLAIITLTVYGKNNVLLATQVLNQSGDPGANQKPLGVWRVGIDPYGSRRELEMDAWPETLPAWFDLNEYPAVIVDRIEINIKNPTNPQPFVKLGMVGIGKRLVLDSGISYGHSISTLSSGNLGELYNARVIRSGLRRKAKSFQFGMEHLTSNDRANINRLDRAYPNDPVYLCAFPGETGFMLDDYSFMGFFADTPQFSHQFFGYHSTSLTLKEAG